MLEIVNFALGPAMTNVYLVADTKTREAAVIDPAWDGEKILAEANKRDWQIAHIWYTHAHFDHIAGAGAIVKVLNPPPKIALHPADKNLWQSKGGAALFGFDIDAGPEPDINLKQGQILDLGTIKFEVRHAPGHTAGLCIFYVPSDEVCFCGDLIFRDSVGRTDLPGGNWDLLLKSVHEQVFTLPGETRLLSGHGPETTVGEEKQSNPFVGLGLHNF